MAAPSGLLAAAVAAGAVALWPGPAGRAAAGGLGAAWLLALAGVAALLAARPVSASAFWWAFWGGVGARLAALGGLTAVCLRFPRVSSPGLLCGYAVGLALLLPWEFRRVPLRGAGEPS